MYSIFLNTFREIIRGKFLSLWIFFIIVEIFGLLFLNTLSLGQSEYIVADFWLSFIEIIGVFIILFLGNRLLSREFEEKTIYLTLSRPISRGSIIFGKFFGFSANILILITVLFIVLIGILAFFSAQITPILIIAFFGIISKLLILIAIALLFSIFLSSGIATFGTLAIYVVGHSGYTLLEYGLLNENIFFEKFATAIMMIFPNFMALNFKSQIHLNLPLDFSHIGIIFLLAILYLTILLFLSKYIFEKKSFDNI